jgi:hypothetical protein
MIVLAFAVIGALVGGFTAKNRGGKGLDIAQYAAGYAMAFAVVGLFVSVFLMRA